jgi:hypothetical protein
VQLIKSKALELQKAIELGAGPVPEIQKRIDVNEY